MIKWIVGDYLGLKDRDTLANLRAHRKRLRKQLQGRAAGGIDIGLAMHVFDEELHVIEAAIYRLERPDALNQLSEVENWTMGFLEKLFRREPGTTDELLSSIYGSVTAASAAPDALEVTEYELMKIARQRKGHVSFRAVGDEYNRLLAERKRTR
jgi:hypothetical protein